MNAKEARNSLNKTIKQHTTNEQKELIQSQKQEQYLADSIYKREINEIKERIKEAIEDRKNSISYKPHPLNFSKHKIRLQKQGYKVSLDSSLGVYDNDTERFGPSINYLDIKF